MDATDPLSLFYRQTPLGSLCRDRLRFLLSSLTTIPRLWMGTPISAQLLSCQRQRARFPSGRLFSGGG